MDIKINNLSVKIGETEILNSIDIEIPKNEITAIVGRNGSGKSTLASCICGLIDYTGRVSLGNTDISSLTKREIAEYVSVMGQFLPSPSITAYELMEISLESKKPISKRLSAHDRDAIINCLSDLGIQELKDRRISTLSGGERRLVFLASSIARDCPIMIFDEASAYMDKDNEGAFLERMRSLKNKGKTVISVIHELSDTVAYADNILLLDGGRVAFFGTVSEILDTNILETTMNVERYTLEKRIFFSHK